MQKKIFNFFLIILILHSYNSFADTKLNVNRFEQKYQFSCETAALRMVLNYHGLNISEDTIISKMPFDKTKNDNGIWGDPDKGFVGLIDGKSSQESYGIHWVPLQKLASNWKRTEVLENGTVADLINNIKSKRPVIVWIYSGEKKVIHWKTIIGKKVDALLEEHTVVITGFKGNIENIEGFYIADPAKNQKLKYLKKDDFLKIWSGFKNKAVVVYP